MNILIKWYHNNELYEEQHTTLARFFEDNPDHCQGCKTTIRNEIKAGGHTWSGFGGIRAEVTRDTL